MHGTGKNLTPVDLTAVGHTESDNVDNKRHIILAVDSPAGGGMTLKIKGSISDELPDFSAAATKDNQWAYVQCKDLDVNSDVNGDTGIVFANGINKMFEVNTNGLKHVCAEVAAYTAGSVHVQLRAYND